MQLENPCGGEVSMFEGGFEINCISNIWHIMENISLMHLFLDLSNYSHLNINRRKVTENIRASAVSSF